MTEAGQVVIGPATDAWADSMFRFEQPNEEWIDRCADYLHRLFGDRIKGARVVDYGFGRGNWALAFRKAGAAQVVAIDAARSNIERFGAWCQASGVDGIDIRHGDVITAPMGEIRAEIVWVYGLLHHVADDDLLLARLRSMLTGPEALMAVYAYDRGSLRQWVVETARSGITYPGEAEFRADALLLTPDARLRARDDLCCPVVRWYDAAGLQSLLGRHGLGVVAQAEDFATFLAGEPSAEFQPHVALCRPGSHRCRIGEPKRPLAPDVAVLAELAGALAESAARRQIALGLFNTHFTALAGGGAATAVVQDFLFLLYAISAESGRRPQLGAHAEAVLELSRCALAGVPRPEDLAHRTEGVIAAHLARHNVRL